MTRLKIENLEEIIHDHIEEVQKIVDLRVTTLDTTEWESNFLRIDVTLKDENRYTQQEVNLVGKLIPEDRPSNIKKEIGFYKIIVPTLQHFQKQQGDQEILNCFPKFLGARINLETKSDTLLVLTNLQEEGYQNARETDLPTTRLILKHLAQFHGVSIGLKLMNPENFERKLKPFMTDRDINDLQVKEIDLIRDVLRRGGYLNVASKIDENLKNHSNKVHKEPFTTICHGNMWIKNILVKLNHGDPCRIKFLDFQRYSFNSIVQDLMHYLATSVQLHVLKENMDDLLQFYYQHLIETLENLKCNNVEKFSYNIFLEEIATHTVNILPSILFIIMIIDARTESEDPRCPNSFSHLLSCEKMSVKCKERIWWIVEEFERKGWLNL